MKLSHKQNGLFCGFFKDNPDCNRMTVSQYSADMSGLSGTPYLKSSKDVHLEKTSGKHQIISLNLCYIDSLFVLNLYHLIQHGKCIILHLFEFQPILEYMLSYFLFQLLLTCESYVGFQIATRSLIGWYHHQGQIAKIKMRHYAMVAKIARNGCDRDRSRVSITSSKYFSLSKWDILMT